MTISNREVFARDPLDPKNELANQGVAEIVDPRSEHERRTLRYELETFVCEGQYARGLERILTTYLEALGREEQPAVWISGFYGSGKSHLAKMLRFLWADFTFPDGATARGLAHLPQEIQAHLRELSTQGKRFGGLHAAGGKLDMAADEDIRLGFLRIVFRSVGLPEDYAAARFVLYLRRNGYLEAVKDHLARKNKTFERELNYLYVSPVLAETLLEIDPDFAPDRKHVRAQIKEQFPRVSSISEEEMVSVLNEVLARDGRFPCTLVVLDEVQQYIGDNADRAYAVQQLAETCSKRFDARLLLVGTGQNALTATPYLQKLQDRFRLQIELSDTDVDTVVRRIVLRKKPDKEPVVRKILSECSGEISRHLRETKIGPKPEDNEFLVADYPLLPVRRRFWERAMRAIDPTGTKAELRNQLINVFEAIKKYADDPLGTVVPADFIYWQNATAMVQTGVLLREFQELIAKQDDGTRRGRLKARLCALCFLIGKFPREAGADVGVRATPEMLADLLVENLREGSTELRKTITALLDELVDAGILIRVENEYRLQTRESAAWEADYRERLARLRNDAATLASERVEQLREAVEEALKGIKITQGESRVPRQIVPSFGRDEPAPDERGITVWVRDGWNEKESSVLADIRRANLESPLVTVFVPSRHPEEFRNLLASIRAREETLNARGHPSTPEGIEARKAMETRLEEEKARRQQFLHHALEQARVFLAGGHEKIEGDFAERVRSAVSEALARKYPRFTEADHPRWGTVYERARKGDPNALAVVGYQGSPEQHPICREILRFVGSGKKGRDILRNFQAPPFGWSKDAIDAVLILLVVTEHLRALRNGKPLMVSDLDHRSIPTTDFRRETIVLGVTEKLELRKLFQRIGLPVQPNGEVQAAQAFVRELRSLAERAGGEPPLPPPPNPPKLAELEALSGNELLAALFEVRDELSAWAEEWKTQAEQIEDRLPQWQCLERLLQHAKTLHETTDLLSQADAIREQRSLLADPDPVAPLVAKVAQVLREALQKERSQYEETYARKKRELEEAEAWRALDPHRQAEILTRHDLVGVPEIAVGSTDELLMTLAKTPLHEWASRRDALPARFRRALEDAQRLLEPEAIPVTLPPPPATLRDEETLRAWLKRIEAEISAALKRGPVILRWG